MRAPSIRDVARETGYGKTTVARALSNSPLVKAKTAQQIVAVAERIGYRRDPLVAELASRRWRMRSGMSPQPLAYVFNLAGKVATTRHDSFFSFAAASAAQFGYRVEEFNLADYSSNARAAKVLYSRNYRGLLIGRILDDRRGIDLPWDRFIAVGCGIGLIRPPVHAVEEDYASAAWFVTNQAIKHGYRRPGYVHLRHTPDELIDPNRLGGYTAAREALPPADRLPVHVGLFKPGRSHTFEAWLKTYKPDVVIGMNNLVYWWIRNAGLRVPDDLAYVSLSNEGWDEADITGMMNTNEAVAKAAVELLIGQIHLNAHGVPHPLQTVGIESEWFEGATLPMRREALRKRKSR